MSRRIVEAETCFNPLIVSLSSLCTGVETFDVSLEKQSVIVKGTAPYDTVLEKIKKTGKEVREGKVIA